MAALPDTPHAEVVELAQVTVPELDVLLEDEIRAWRQRFAWDFRPSADLLRRFLQMHSLSGYALRSAGRIAGYAYHVCEGRKGLIGDFYVLNTNSRNADELTLLGAIVGGLMRTPGVRRIESQLMMQRGGLTHPPFSRFLTRHDRFFMQMETAGARKVPVRPATVPVTVLPWSERYGEEIAHVVSAAYRGHVDSDINDQYRSIPGARHFLMNIIKFPGCGNFSPDASLVALDPRTGRVCGVCLASLVSSTSGHITQLCVLPALRGAHLGYELMRQSMLRLLNIGCDTVSLTVTCANENAIRLYQELGFRAQATFPALVWEGF